ncbi:MULTISPECIES: IbrB-like domain-containing protein [unclassified Bradyrhizobium]|uniref:IbrB-like domain-containing protein n=1 Tax=Bradyrhizobium sp. USDA 4541 TaxID=2817704 RepID=UPI0020A44DEC|nr:ParB/RepB/Spo0J family partition protein [Bradyrhizobium sp. USDA 4541]MCP1848134.1 ParB-like chromosome segregation protein Spo0J [Bradyrhizobium sp. USDA 4541]
MQQVAKLVQRAEGLFRELDSLPLGQRVEAINRIRQHLHAHSPFADEPVDCVQWVRCDRVHGNDYNPNTVAPPEMQLLTLSVEADGFTQPIVTHEEAPNYYVVVDGFHRQQVCKKPGSIRKRLRGYVPVVSIRAGRKDQADRIAATIRHNRARGVHGVLPMTDIVVMLLRAGWNEIDVARELGMDVEEVLRFKQVSGLPELFRDHKYSPSWD